MKLDARDYDKSVGKEKKMKEVLDNQNEDTENMDHIEDNLEESDNSAVHNLEIK